MNDSVLIKHNVSEPGFKLEPFQRKVIKVLEKMESKGNYSTIVELPTGSGKTTIAVHYILENAINKQCKVLWLTHRDFLISEAEKEFKKRFTKEICPNITELNIQKKLGSNLENVDIIITTYLSAKLYDTHAEMTALAKWIKEQEEDKKLFIVVDEAHHAGAQEYCNLFEQLFCNNKVKANSKEGNNALVDKEALVRNYALIGLTATPYRGDFNEIFLFKWFKDGYKEKYDKKAASDDPQDYINSISQITSSNATMGSFNETVKASKLSRIVTVEDKTNNVI